MLNFNVCNDCCGAYSSRFDFLPDLVVLTTSSFVARIESNAARTKVSSIVSSLTDVCLSEFILVAGSAESRMQA